MVNPTKAPSKAFGTTPWVGGDLGGGLGWFGGGLGAGLGGRFGGGLGGGLGGFGGRLEGSKIKGTNSKSPPEHGGHYLYP